MRTALLATLIFSSALSCAPLALAQVANEQVASEPTEYGAVATAARMARPIREVPAQVTVLSREEIARNPALTTDALLRSLPAVATFRRSSSLVADPSSQGLNLRGVAPSGVSRTLVLTDGIPANDPFGGWIYWRSLPRLGLSRVEVVPGGSSALYGSAALAGVVELFPRTAHENSVEGEVLFGSFQTVLAAARVAHDFGKIGAAVEGEWLSSDGYKIVAEDQRGPIDGNTPSAHGSVQARVEARAHRRLNLWSAVSLFHEAQNGGTKLTTARASLASLSLGATLSPRHGGKLRLSAFGRLTRFEQQRARIAPERASESLAARQDVPAHDEGGSLTYQSPVLQFGGEHRLGVGLDVRHIAADSRERLFPPAPGPESNVRRNIEGQQLLAGAYVQDVYKVQDWLGFEGALRFSWARTYDATLTSVRQDGERAASAFSARQSYAVTPRLGAFVHVLDALTLRAAGYQSFRVPTLNELYRPFQVGTVLTAANADLKPELLLGAELGFDWTVVDALILRATGFFNQLDRPITNLTLAMPAANGAMRQRGNLGQAVVRGVETSLEGRFSPEFSGILSYTLVDSRVTDSGTYRELLGNRLAQDPVHRAAVSLAFDDPRILSAYVQLRVIGKQYEDDLNTRPMGAAWLLDASLSRRIVWHLEVYAAAENLLNRTYLVGRAGVDTLGAPFSARVGLRVREPRRP